MANKQLIFQNAVRDLVTGQFFSVILIDGGASYTMYVRDLPQPPVQPANVAQITTAGATPVIAPSGGGDVVGLGTTNNYMLWTDGPNSVAGDGLLLQAAGNVRLPTGALILSALTANAFIYSGTAGQLTSTAAPTNGQLLIGSTGAAPVAASLTAGANITITPGAGTITIAATAAAGTVTGTGTIGTIPKFSAASVIADSIITEAAGVITVTGQLSVTQSIKLAIRTVTNADSPVTLAAADYTVLADATANPITINLPAAAGASGRIFNIKKIDATANAVTIDGNGAETIDGAATQVLVTQWFSLALQSNGTAWFLI